jgi:hypothetical protein
MVTMSMSSWAGTGPCNASANLYYCPDPTKEADCLLRYYQTAIFPWMNVKQRAFFIPGLFGPGEHNHHVITIFPYRYTTHCCVLHFG